MDQITSESVKRLLKTSGPVCVSVYLPTERSTQETLHNRNGYKRLLSQVQDGLLRRGIRAADANELLQPAFALYDDSAFWHEPEDGVAVFCSAMSYVNYRLRAAFTESACIGSRPHTKPLLPLLTADDQYYLLVVSDQQVRLLAGSRTELRQVARVHSPHTLADVRQHQASDAPVLVHAGPTATPGQPSHAPNGQRNTDQVQEPITAFFRQIDRALVPYFREHSQGFPLVFCGPQALFPLYQAANTYPHLYGQPIVGEFDHLRALDLLNQAQKVLAPHWTAQQRRDLEQMRTLAGTWQVSADMESILPAACEGRVEAIVVASDAELPGTYDGRARKLRLGETTDHCEDLLDLAAAETLLHDGRAYAMKAKFLPLGSTAAALYRYPL